MYGYLEGFKRKKLLITLLLISTVPCYAAQFKQWQGVIINKQAISKIAPYTNKNGSFIQIYYMTGNGMGYGATQSTSFYTTLSYKTDTERNNALKQLLQWLNEKN